MAANIRDAQSALGAMRSLMHGTTTTPQDAQNFIDTLKFIFETAGAGGDGPAPDAVTGTSLTINGPATIKGDLTVSGALTVGGTNLTTQIAEIQRKLAT